MAAPKCSFQAQTTSRWSAHWRFAFKPAPAGRGVLGLAPVLVTRSCSAAEAGPRLSIEDAGKQTRAFVCFSDSHAAATTTCGFKSCDFNGSSVGLESPAVQEYCIMLPINR